MTRITATIFAALCTVAAMSQNSISLNGQWKFCFAKQTATADSLAEAGFYKPDYNDSRFDPISVPSCWAVLGYEEPVYRGFKKQNDDAGEGLYRRTFLMPRDMAGQRVLLHFGGVWASAEVWVNGEWIGRHDSGYTSFSMDVTKAVKAGRVNVLAVRVRQVCPGYQTDTYDDWTLGGIYRDVTLESMPAKRRIDRVRIESRMTGEVKVKVMVADTHKNTLPGNYMSPDEPYQLRITLTDAEGKDVAAQTVSVKGHPANSRETCVTLNVRGAHLWTAETPYLYTLRTELIDEEKHTVTQKVGIREISTKDGVLRINGQAVKLRGVNRHDEHPDVGRATTREHWLQDLRLMKQANINYIRACHYQHAKGFIEMCDSMGFYVGSEVSLGGADNLMYDPAFTAAAAQRTIETVERDLNNPSIIYWSIGNEDSFTDMFLQMARLVKGLDPSRPMLLPWNADETLPEEIDILAPHYWTAREYDSIASQSKRPIITTEYVHAYGNQRMGGLQECWQSLTRHEAGAGGAVWMWADQGLKTPTKKDRQKYGSLAKDDDYLRLDAQGWDGITDSYRRPTRDYWEVKAVYCPITATLNDGKVVVYNGYDFLDMNTIHIKWQTFAEGKALKEGTATLDAKPHQTAILSVDSKKADCLWLTYTDSDGKEIGRQSIALRKTEMKKSRLALTIDPATGLPEGFRPTVWHKLNDGDQIIKNRSFAQSPEKYTVKVLSIEGNRSRVRYEINDSNSIEATYIITHGQHGTTIDYELTPRLQSTYVPVVGLAYKMKNVKTLKHWYGLGPDEAYPNKQAAPLLGLWNASQVEGTRRMQWVEVDGRRICCDGYLDRDDANAKEIRLLSHVLGRSEKGRLNYPEYQLPQGRTYKGSITIQ